MANKRWRGRKRKRNSNMCQYLWFGKKKKKILRVENRERKGRRTFSSKTSFYGFISFLCFLS